MAAPALKDNPLCNPYGILSIELGLAALDSAGGPRAALNIFRTEMPEIVLATISVICLKAQSVDEVRAEVFKLATHLDDARS